MQRFNISKNDAKFVVNEEKRTIVCVIEHTKDMFYNFAARNLDICIDPFEYKNWNNYTTMLQMPDRFIGIAKCSNDDEWNVELGKKIAFLRAKTKVLNSFYKRANKCVEFYNNKLLDFVDMVNDLGEKHANNLQRQHDWIEEQIGGDVEQNYNG